MDKLVDVDTLASNLHKRDWVVLDCRFSLADPHEGQRKYQHDHIPRSIYAHLGRDLSDMGKTASEGRHPLPDMRTWLVTLGNWGIHPSAQVICYDDAGGAFAARAWWLVRAIGHHNVAVLDGGWQAWNTGSPAMSVEAADILTYPAYPKGEPLTRQVNAEDIISGSFCLLDARDAPRFKGEVEPIDAKAGHIPGANNSPFAENLTDAGFFKPSSALRAKFEAAINGSSSLKGDQIVCYCGSGVTAAHNVLAMKIAGFDEPLLYAGSWSEWIINPDHPIETS